MNTNIHTMATSTKGKGYGNPNASIERQGDAGWGVARHEPRHEIVNGKLVPIRRKKVAA